nr:hypothetical protein [uncultured Roseibium sp.]
MTDMDRSKSSGSSSSGVELYLTGAFEGISDSGLHAGMQLGDLIAQDMIAVRLTDPLRLAVVGTSDVAVADSLVVNSPSVAAEAARQRSDLYPAGLCRTRCSRREPGTGSI